MSDQVAIGLQKQIDGLTQRYYDFASQEYLISNRVAVSMVATDTSGYVNVIPNWVSAGHWVVFLNGANTEVRRINSISGKQLSWTGALANGHASGNAVLFVSTPRLNVKWWGATGDGSTDDTASIQAAMSAADGLSNAPIFFPDGTYIITSVLTWFDGCIMLGAGWRQTAIVGSALTGPMIYDNSSGSNGMTDSRLSGIQFRGNSAASGNHILSFSAGALRYCEIDHCWFHTCGGDAIHIQSRGPGSSEGISYSINIHDNKFGGTGDVNSYGIYAIGSVNMVSVKDNHFSYLAKHAIYLQGTSTYTLENWHISRNGMEQIGMDLGGGGTDALVAGVYVGDYTGDINIEQNYMEGCGNADTAFQGGGVVVNGVNASSVKVRDNIMASQPYHVRLINVSSAVIDGNWFNWNGSEPSSGNKQYSISIENVTQYVWVGNQHNINASYPFMNNAEDTGATWRKVIGLVDQTASGLVGARGLTDYTVDIYSENEGSAGAYGINFYVKDSGGTQVRRAAFTSYEDDSRFELMNDTGLRPTSTTSLPTAGAGYRGNIMRKHGAAAQDELYMCVLEADGSTYSWLKIA